MGVCGDGNCNVGAVIVLTALLDKEGGKSAADLWAAQSYPRRRSPSWSKIMSS
jgi:hypothetical protein